MRSPVASVALTVALAMLPVASGYAPARSQDFSITNTVEPPNAGRRDVMRQLQAWWDVHAYYPRHASQADEGGNVKLHLMVRPDGNIFTVDVAESSGSRSLDAAGAAAFRGGFVRPFPAGTPEAALDISVHYILAHRHDEVVAANYAPASSRRPFTIMNDPVKSPILETMMQRTCTGTVVKQGIRNHSEYGVRYQAEAVFFRKPDGTPWVKFYEGGYPILASVTEVGKIVRWTGREERFTRGPSRFTHYTVWPDGENRLSGNLDAAYPEGPDTSAGFNNGGTVDLSCASEIVPAITWSAMSVTPGKSPAGDPP